ncbi:MAG: undecaprenyl/decaprenyl-phosphate alpha-N-acetylglucosaminyl 1-phosphate transferase [candidate division Zixibacteria bacterium]|nr:undecaprenyl/decaprenyl-phosphate alpha-N-acetylglucosaminyl 1-phosphate transferase [candidate division Zixibacteria bacterium]MDH3936819.1 undecaprenyl/decaprenyl-phosphate alpha-N-acetylglucosaminyl 1-phosphate transferase [candidate division Zixibacteria bacterium]MDH4033888.1 undecaprenyl/decaprenyl-phosphate alpha-N-acetylglucosaminyl 1-phosphate transferase [candidate division Zixibacteria bacterium]
MPFDLILVVGVTSLAITAISLPVLIRLGHRHELLDRPGKHKRHKRPVPYLGGVALFFAVWLALLVCGLVFPEWSPGASSSLFYVFLGAMVITLVGLADDLSPLSAHVKLAAQILVGLMLYAAGISVEFLTTPYGSVDVGAASLLITVLWVVVMTNALNLIDGLDGLAGGVALIAAITLLVIGRLLDSGWGVLFMPGLIGFLAGFLVYNRYPARVFLGDSGSMQLGYYFAVFSLLAPLKSFTASALYLPLLALGVPILETAASFLRRMLSGRNVMQADRRHLFHYLSLAGLSPRKVVLVFYGLGVVFSGFALGMFLWNRVIVLAVLAVFMVVILVSFFILVTGLVARRRRNRRSANGTVENDRT